VSSDEPISQAVHLDCPNSIPIGDDRKLTIRTVTFEDVNRLQEVFEFEIPESDSPTFKLFVQPQDKFEAAINNRPDEQDSKICIDPIYGDEVVAVHFKGFALRN
jgi:hypothetical protein